jgi:choline dehydrogenase
MLSGVGPAAHLREHGIGVVADLPGVGRNLHDHLKLSIRWTGRIELSGSTVTAGLFVPPETASWPDLQFYVGRGLDQPERVVTITASLVRPRSRGAITLRSADADAAPVIRMNYLEAQADVDVLVRGVGLARAFGASAAYDRVRSEEIEPGKDVASAADLDRYVRRMSDSIYHAAGTCRMGPASDADAVVNARLQVHGLDGLRVADASIMPEVVNAPTHAACVMIGEACADMVTAG